MSSVQDAGEPRGLRQRQVRMAQGKPCASEALHAAPAAIVSPQKVGAKPLAVA
jgi:hypothetical protein